MLRNAGPTCRETLAFLARNTHSLAGEALPPPSDISPGSRAEWDFNPPERVSCQAHTTGCPAPVPRIGTLALAVCAACDLSLRIGEQVLTFRTRAWLSFAPPTCRMPLGRASGFPRTDPGGRVIPRF